jgi:hypothetical protein
MASPWSASARTAFAGGSKRAAAGSRGKEKML